MNIIRYYYEQIFELLVPDLTKYIIYSANNNLGIFSSLNKQSELSKIIGPIP